jgi:pyruvate kinase
MPARPAHPPPTRASVRSLAAHLEAVRDSLLELESAVDLSSFGAQRESARNLLHYLAFRRYDLRRAQSLLTSWGLSSLGRSEGHVLHNMEMVLGWLDRALGKAVAPRPGSAAMDPEYGREILQENAQGLLGPTRAGRGVRIMVTMPAEAASDYPLVRDLLRAGMDCARINCAHDGPREWSQMIAHIRRAERAAGHPCTIEMDLAGPKIRTGPLPPGPAVLKLRPTRDPLGRVTAPATVRLVPRAGPARPPGSPPDLTVSAAWLRRRHARESVRFVDARAARRTLRLLRRQGRSWEAVIEKTAYLTPGTRLVASLPTGAKDVGRAGRIPPIEQRLRLHLGDHLLLTSHPLSEAGPRPGADGRSGSTPAISCTCPEALAFVRPGHSIWFDDGKIGGVVRAVRPSGLEVQITRVSEEGAWLAADKGINLPDTNLDLPPLLDKDREDLRFIARHADVVGYSFVHSASDLTCLRDELDGLGRPRMGIVVKVETRRAFENLPGILLESLRRPPVAVMIARGDLGVEVGYERLAELQEEILWLCEAAHIPVIWATQVLESLAKTGLPSRAEVTDAAMGERAECVMLNKGPHVLEAVRALDSILRRMRSHQEKKSAMLRHLHVVNQFVAEHPAARPEATPAIRGDPRGLPVGPELLRTPGL